MKKLLFLGGSDIQVPGIEFAKSLGYYIITCDYLPDNPGHKISDKYYDISTTDLEGNITSILPFDTFISLKSLKSLMITLSGFSKVL